MDLPQVGSSCIPAPTATTINARGITLDAVRFENERDAYPKPFRGALGELLGDRHIVRETKPGTPCLSFATYEPNTTRGNCNVTALTAIGLDFDHISAAQLEQVVTRARDYACALYSTFSDMVGGPDDRCVRVVFPSQRPLSPDEHLLVRDELVLEIGVPADNAARDPSRIWYVPACPPGREAEAFVTYTDGPLLDPEPYLRIARESQAAVAAPSQRTDGAAALERDGELPSAPPISIERLTSRLERLRDSDSRVAIAAVIAGEPFAQRGRRDTTLWRIMSTAAFVAPEAAPDVLVQFVAPSLARMAEQDPSDHLTVDDARDMATRALADARARQVRNFERGDEVEIGKAAVEVLKADTELVFAEGAFYRYNSGTGLYETVQREAMSREVQKFAGRLIVGGDKPRVLKLSRSMVGGSMGLAGDQVSRPNFFDEAPSGIAFQNGFVTVTAAGAVLEPHSAAHRCRTALPFDYSPDATCERFSRFLDEVFRDDEDARLKMDAIQEFSGACLLGIATRYARALVLLGPGRNGKSVFIEVLLALFDESVRSAVPPQSFESDYHRALLAGKLINSVSELPRADILRGESFKALVAGDVTVARQIYCPPVIFKPRAGHIMGANALPGSDDLTVAFFERMLIILFNRIFAQEERDKTLARRIIDTELPGVALWAIRGAERLLGRGDHGGYTQPPSHATALEEWRLRADQVRQFIEERTRPTTSIGRRTQAKVLYREYRKWALENGHKCLANPTFGARVKALGIGWRKPHSRAFYEVELLPETDDALTTFRGDPSSGGSRSAAGSPEGTQRAPPFHVPIPSPSN